LQEALTVASVEGETFTAEVVAQVHGDSEREMVGWLSHKLERGHRLVSARGIRQVDGNRLSRYQFRHILFQRYLYQNLDPAERAYLHEAVGAALEELYGERTGEIAVQLARHFQEAGVAEKAIDYLHRAGERAVRLSAHQEAIAHFSQGLRLLEGLPETPERIRRELNLATYARALELCEHAYAGDTPRRFQVLLGLRRFYFMRGQLGTAHELGEQLLSLAQSLGNATHLSRAHAMQGEVLLHLGAFPQTREQCEQGMARYDPQQRRSHILLYGNDTETGLRISEALAWWYLGYPDRALQRSREMVALAQELSHPFSQAIALHFAATIHQLRREAQAAQEGAEAVLQISTERGFALFLAWGTVVRGWALAERGAIEEGTARMQQGVTAWRETGAAIFLPDLLALLAEVYWKVGRAEEGLSLIDEALALVDKNGERCWEAELYRLKGELLLIKPKAEVEAGAKIEAKTEADACYREVERCFERALEVARRQGAKSWELRAAMSLCRLQHSRGSQRECEAARDTLADIYGWFSDGFDTADLREAKALLEELS
jgi:predicted ATPase